MGTSIVIRHGKCGGMTTWASLDFYRGREIKAWLLMTAERGDLVEVYVGDRPLAPICECGRGQPEGSPDG